MLRFCVSIAVVCFSVTAANADDYNEYIRKLKLLSVSEPKPTVANIASGFGAGHGQAYIAASYSDRDLQTDLAGDDDGSIALGFGLGNPNRLGGEVTVGITSVSTGLWGDGKFADEGNLSFKVYKRLSPILNGRDASASVGVSNVWGWGDTRLNPRNYYAVYSEKFLLGEIDQYGVMYSIGYGTGISNAETKADAFYGIGFGYNQMNISVSQVGSEAHLTGMLFFEHIPQFALAVSKADVLNKTGARRTIISVSYSANVF